MSDSKKQENKVKQDEQKKQQTTTISNPFVAYNSNSYPPLTTNKQPPRKMSSSPSYRSQSSQHQRSRSRDKQRNREPKESKESPKKQQKQKQRYESKNSDYSSKGEGTSQPVSKDEHKQEQAAYFKTKLCPLFDKGLCKKGGSCNFAHGEKELRGLPNFRKTRLCIPFKNGECSKSSNECKYAHGEGELKKLAYDYFPQKQQHYQAPRERDDRNYDKFDNRRYRERQRDRQYRQYRDYRDYSRDRDRHRDYKDYRDRDRQRERQRDRDRDRYNKDYQGRNTSMPPPPYPGFMPNYNSAYMIPPPSMNVYGHPGELYPSGSNTNTALSGNVAGSSSFSSSGPNMSGSSYPPGAPLYGMGSYDYSYGYMGSNYLPPPPYTGSSV